MSLLYTRPDALAKCDERAEHDHYPTPVGLVHATLNKFISTVDYGGYERPRHILDVGAGNDAIWCLEAHDLWGAHTTGIELRDVPHPLRPFSKGGLDPDLPEIPAVDEWYGATDYFAWQAPRQYDAIIGNIPYGVAEPMLRKIFSEVKPGGWVVQLLLLGFTEGINRAKGFWQEFPLYEKWTLARRPSFRPNKHGKKGTDARAYAIYVWRKGYGSFNEGWRERILQW
jgi:hypothetical protein